MKGRSSLPWLALATLALVVSVASGPAAARTTAGQPAVAEPVPSLTPEATDRLWRELVAHPRAAGARAAACVPVRAVFYAATDWLRLATKLAANPSPCADYFISVPPLSANKTQFRTGQAELIRALGPAFHALAEINVTGWTTWVSDNGATWHEAGVEARRRMFAAGYDVSAGETWALNELFSDVRQNVGSARTDMRDFMDGLYDGDGVLPTARGVVWTIGIGQQTTNLSVYKSRLQDWYADTQWWTAMSRDVSDWQQEVYGDVRHYAVPGAPKEARRDALNEYLQHPATLAAAAPANVGAAKTFLAAAYSPLANAAWQWASGFGYTDVPVDLMQDFVSAQVYAARSAGNARFGLAWQPQNLDGIPAGDFTAQTDALLVRLAAAIADSSEAPEGACGAAWCNRDLAGASFTTAWRTFATWTGPVGPDTIPPETFLSSGPSGTVASRDATFAFFSTEAGSDFECAFDGGPVANCSSPVGYAGLVNGSHTFQVRAIDPAGNPDPTLAVRTWTVLVEEGRPLPPASGGPRADVPAFTAPGGPRVPPPAH